MSPLARGTTEEEIIGYLVHNSAYRLTPQILWPVSRLNTTDSLESIPRKILLYGALLYMYIIWRMGGYVHVFCGISTIIFLFVNFKILLYYTYFKYYFKVITTHKRMKKGTCFERSQAT